MRAMYLIWDAGQCRNIQIRLKEYNPPAHSDANDEPSAGSVGSADPAVE